MNRHDSYWIFGGQTLIIQAISSSSFPFLFQQGVSLDCLVTCLSDEDIQKGGTTMRDDHATHHLTGEREREREKEEFSTSRILDVKLLGFCVWKNRAKVMQVKRD